MVRQDFGLDASPGSELVTGAWVGGRDKENIAEKARVHVTSLGNLGSGTLTESHKVSSYFLSGIQHTPPNLFPFSCCSFTCLYLLKKNQMYKYFRKYKCLAKPLEYTL